MLPGALAREVVAGVGVAHHAGAGVVPQHALDARRGGVGMGYSQHAGVVIVCDGSDAAAKRIERVLWNDPGTGVMRHADAGYDEAVQCAREQGLKLPMMVSP